MVAKKKEATEPVFTISYVFDAPRALVWQICTQPEHMKNWFGPKGFAGRVAKMDFRPGGIYHYCLQSSDGKEMWGKFVYQEIVPPERIVWVNSFSDEKAVVTRHPMHQSWPLEMLTTFTLTEDKGKTTVTIEWSPINPTPEERKTFEDGMAGMTQGWTGTLDQLDGYLKKAKKENFR